MKSRRLGLRKHKVLSVSNGNLYQFKWENIHVVLNIKYTAIYSKTWPGSLIYIQKRLIQNPFKRLIKVVIFLGVTIFTKSSILDV